MISARRAAALGLTVPLSAIMIAVLGLWPEQVEDEIKVQPSHTGAPDGPPSKPPMPNWERERHAIQVLDDEMTLLLGLIASGALEWEH